MEVKQLRVDPSVYKDFADKLRRRGRLVSDFELIPSEEQYRKFGVGPVSGTVTVRSKKTDKQRVYRTGHGTAWVPQFGRGPRCWAIRLGRWPARARREIDRVREPQNIFLWNRLLETPGTAQAETRNTDRSRRSENAGRACARILRMLPK